MQKEIWRIVPSAPQFMVSNEGRIMTTPYQGKMPRGGVRSYGGQPYFGAWADIDSRFLVVHKGKSYKVARLVCEAFNGPCTPEKPVCMHLDENPKNNSADNLAWGTQKQNLNAPGFIEYCKGRVGEKSPRVKGLAQIKGHLIGANTGDQP